MDTERLSRLREEASLRGMDCVALMPGANLFHLTGLSFHLSERPVVALFPVDAPPGAILPTLEAPKLEQSTCEMDAFPYSDEEGPTLAFHEACARLELAEARIGIEELRMRLMEGRHLERYAPGCELVPADEMLAQLRMRKDTSELALMRRAVEIAEAALERTVGQLQVGMTEREVAGRLMVEMLHAGGEGVPFQPIVVAGPNAASPHAVPSDRPIQAGETIVIDCGTLVGGYASDITRTFAIDGLPAEMTRVHEVVRRANQAGHARVAPGVAAQELDRAARQVIEEAGYGEYFVHRTGHGLGLEAHEAPYIVEGNQEQLQPGMTFTIEPGIYLPGRGGVRIEDDVVVTPQGGESLTTFSRQLRIL